jgi:hypothetical protein
MDSHKHATTTQIFNQELRFESPFAGGRASSTVGSQHTIDLTVLRDHSDHDDPKSQSLVAGIDHNGIHTQAPSPSKSGRWASLDDSWLLECLAMVFSFASFIAIIIILVVYDQKPSPNLSYGLTLNTIVSLLATASRSSLLFAVAAAVGQLKWMWFQRREQPISDMQSFDDATRGPLGSLTLLFQHRGLSLASLGAIVTVLAVAIDPFIQQILSYPVQQIPSSTAQATMPQAQTFAPNANYASFTQYYNAALWNTDFPVNPTCPSGNCTWPEFQSLGFCSKCQDVTDSAILYDCDQWTEPEINDTDTALHGAKYSCSVNTGHGGNGTVVVSYLPTSISIPTDAVWSLVEIELGSFLGVNYPVYVFAHAKLEVEPNTNLTKLVRGLRISSVQECALSFCLRTYNVSVSSGTPQVNVTSVDYGQRFTENLPGNEESFYADIDCWRPTDRSGPFDFIKLSTGNWADTKQFAFCLRANEANWTRSGFNSLAHLSSGSPFLGYADAIYMFNNSTSMWTKGESNSNNADYGAAFDRVIDYGLGSVLSDIAAALTKYTLETSNARATGTAMLPQAFVKVSWQWMTFPSVLLVAGFAFWISTMMINRQRRLGLWKSSILPILYNGAEKIDQGLNGSGLASDYIKISQMTQSAQSTRVKLEDMTDGRLQLGRNK